MKAKHLLGPRKLKGEQVQFTCMVDKELFEKANAVRDRFWPAIIKETLEKMIKEKK